MFKDVLVRLGRLDVPRVRPQPAAPPRELTREIVQVLALASRVYHLALLGKAGEAARGYWRAGRSMGKPSPASGWLCRPGALLGALAGYPPQRRAAEVAGLYLPIEKGARRELLADRVVFPDLDRHGRVLHMVGRSLLKDAGLRYLSLNGCRRPLGPGQRAARRAGHRDGKHHRRRQPAPDGVPGRGGQRDGSAGHLLPKLKAEEATVHPQPERRGWPCSGPKVAGKAAQGATARLSLSGGGKRPERSGESNWSEAHPREGWLGAGGGSRSIVGTPCGSTMGLPYTGRRA